MLFKKGADNYGLITTKLTLIIPKAYDLKNLNYQKYNNNNIIFINCNWVVTRWQWLFYTYTNMKNKVTRKFKSGGLHEKHVVVATWKLGNHLSIRL